ncbi:uncharacterized protein N7511_003791 [Penicillium nucicola]|uniref:uncharacterized protein n=1 Tax=Penicillium nucicola TaxID=1850975 RepID=UPI0025458ECF|nr:uncharacterized protein N7511_003791 [Penicillium nucicola]KAJ5766175.1 hypothetical protein N7511_003791 [Penicillium nucicola]
MTSPERRGQESQKTRTISIFLPQTPFAYSILYLAHNGVEKFTFRTPSEHTEIKQDDNPYSRVSCIDSLAIQDWKGGNPKHGQDMLSMIDGTASDIRTVMKFLPCYVDGGHVTWNLLSEEPSVAGAIIIVGSPNITSLLTERLGYSSPSDIVEGSTEWPRSLKILCEERDRAMAKISGKKILILNGALDTLVPSKFTSSWVVTHAHQNEVKYVVQDDSGHWLSVRMVEEIVEWVAQALI